MNQGNKAIFSLENGKSFIFDLTRASIVKCDFSLTTGLLSLTLKTTEGKEYKYDKVTRYEIWK